MFKKFKDKLAEEVKSSPQRLQQFAQAAQAAVTSASSSISDITNNDLFSIGDNDPAIKNPLHENQPNKHLDASLVKPDSMLSSADPMEYHMKQEESQRQRRLSNSSLASDISFRLPSYESPSMYHLQSDMEVSASEAEEKGSFGGMVNLDRVTKEQLYSAYRRTQDRCTKYKNQYSDLARHYKLLERENAKAKNVLVETQDKALRRISELREQCSLEQSAKAHLEKVLRTEIEEKCMKIDSLNTKLSFLQSNNTPENHEVGEKILTEKNDPEIPLINLEPSKVTNEDDAVSSESVLNNKIEKMEQLLNKYKDSLKITKDKNSQLTTELQKISMELAAKLKENEELQDAKKSLKESTTKIQELNENIEELQNKNNSYEFSKHKEMTILDLNLKEAQTEISNLHKKIEVLSKREEEYAISLAENKLSIHKELESKEAEIKTLKTSLTSSQNEIQSLNTVLSDYKNSLCELENEQIKLKDVVIELDKYKNKVIDCQTKLETIKEKYQTLENTNNKLEEEYKCLHLQFKQETAEKLAMIDRNDYLENRNTQLLEDNTKKTSTIRILEDELELLKNDIEKLSNYDIQESNEVMKLNEEVSLWKSKCMELESEIQEERIELDKLQAEIEKLLCNYELVQKQNRDLNLDVEEFKSQILKLKNQSVQPETLKIIFKQIKNDFTTLRNIFKKSSEEVEELKTMASSTFNTFKEQINLIKKLTTEEHIDSASAFDDLKCVNSNLEEKIETISQQYSKSIEELNLVQNENENLKSRMQQNILQNSMQLHDIETINNERQLILCELNNMREEVVHLKTTISLLNNEKDIATDKLKTFEQQNCDLIKKLKNSENELDSLKSDLQKNICKLKDTEERCNHLNSRNDELLKLKQDYDEKSLYALKLENDIENLKSENVSLKEASELISKSLKDIELEINEVKSSHSKIEMEKDHLNSVLEKLERNISGTDVSDFQQSQTIQTTENSKFDLSTITDYSELNTKLTNECNLLRVENKRLQSDIEGLQIHMTKVSKENGELNDKIRELIASSENMLEKHEIDYFKAEIQSGKDKIENLLRENSLLVEENFELKDQLQTQTCNSVSNQLDSGNKTLPHNNEDYLKLLETRNKLETKLNNLEEMNYTVNKDMSQMQENNQKLRLSNEKLERRLDEALVSLRHLHCLQENTELEYLKNILYEYLTGSGTHSYTLAKVLSAVVKFDDKQTDMVLHKEKERQGFLRQLGII